MAESLPEGFEAMDEPTTTDEEGNTVLRAQDDQGNIMTVQRSTDDEGNVVDSTYDPEGNLLDEVAVDNPLPPGPTSSSTTRPSEQEDSSEDSSWSDSDSTVVEEEKGSPRSSGRGPSQAGYPRARRENHDHRGVKRLRGL